MAEYLNIISFTAFGAVTADRVAEIFADSLTVTVDSGKEIRTSLWTYRNFEKGHVLLFIGAAGIAVRSIAEFVRSKETDAAVIVMDEKGQFVIPILSGHIGEANDYALKIAASLGGTPVITTATDVNGLLAVDAMARREKLEITDMKAAKAFAAAILDRKEARILVPDYAKDLITLEGLTPELSAGVLSEDDRTTLRANDAIISPSDESLMAGKEGIQLIPKCLILGVGCRRGKEGEALIAYVTEEMKALGLSLKAVEKVVSIDLKKDEAGLMALCDYLKVPFETYDADALNAVPGDFGHSDFVAKTTGVDNVCERSAAKAGAEKFLLRKKASDGMTLAIGLKPVSVHISENK